MEHAPKPGTGRLGRGPASRSLSLRDVRGFVRSDFTRRITVLLAGLVSGMMLLRLRTASGALPAATSGLFRPDATSLSPAAIGHAIWVPALVLTLFYVVWVWLPWSRRSRRVTVTAYPATLAITLMAGWLWSIDQGKLRTSVVLVIGVWVALVVTLARSATSPSIGFVDRQATQLPFALLLGWMTVMGATNLALLAVVWGRRPWHIPPETWWVLGVVAILAVAMALVRFLPGRLFSGGAVAWGLLMIAYGRLLGQPRAYGVAVAGVVSAVLVLVAAVAVLLWFRSKARY